MKILRELRISAALTGAVRGTAGASTICAGAPSVPHPSGEATGGAPETFLPATPFFFGAVEEGVGLALSSVVGALRERRSQAFWLRNPEEAVEPVRVQVRDFGEDMGVRSPGSGLELEASFQDES